MNFYQYFPLGITLLLLTNPQLHAGQKPNSLTDEEIKAGWELLWDGKTTAGWRAIYLDKFPESGWIVENGELICLGEELPEDKRGGAIITERKYGSFELSFEFKIKEGANSGIKYFIDERLKASMGHGLGLEFAILDNDNWPYPEPDAKRTCGSLYDMVKADPGAARPVGEWNEGRIIVHGNHVEHWLNGRQVVQIEKGTPHYYDLVSKSKYKNIKGWGEFPEGHILIQDEGPRTAFRNIKIRPLGKSIGNASAQYPNILFIYLDDMGYGDLSCTNPDSRIPTPNIDRLAEEGILFTDSHTPAAVCGPSRYGLLTGRYPWRRGEGGMGNGAKFRDVFIEEGRLTLASLLKQKGYNTSQMGKWGLRHNYSDAVLPGREPGDLDAYDFANRKLPGAQLFGFDYTWTLTYLEEESSDIKQPFENSRPVHADLSPLDPHRWLPDSAQKVIGYLRVYAGKETNPAYGINPDNPFFIYWDPTSPHWPYVPNPEFTGKSEAGVYGDFVCEIDHYVGEILQTLEALNLADNTLVIFTSDNGPDKYSYDRLREFDHYSMGTRRGIKTNAFEGSHRLPLIVRWPGVIRPNRQSDHLISLTDWFATFAEITDQKVPGGAGEDSLSFLSLLKNETAPSHRLSVVHHSTRGVFAMRQGDWVYIDSDSPPPDEPDWFRQLRGVVPNSEPGQLYNLRQDPGQSRNLYRQFPEKVEETKQLLIQIRADGQAFNK